MDQTQATVWHDPLHDPAAPWEVADEQAVHALLSALEDEYCRQLLETMTSTFCTAQQISEQCDMPISTTYRKLNTLVDVGLVDTSIRLRRSGHHTKEFAKSFKSVTVRVDTPAGTVVVIEPQETS